jgi:hypothetical protein
MKTTELEVASKDTEYSLSKDTSSSKESLVELKEDKIFDQIDFLLCDSCFWCASYSANYVKFLRCPECSNDKLKSIPEPIKSKDRMRLRLDLNFGFCQTDLR